MITLYSIHRNLISLYQHRYIVKKISVENFGKRSTRSNEKFKWHQSTNRKLVKLSVEWRIKGWLFTARGFQFISSKILNVSSIFLPKRLENTGKEKYFLWRKKKFQKICTFFLLYIKNAWTWYLLCAKVGIMFSVSKGIKITFMFIV